MFFMLFEKKTQTCVALILFTRAPKHNGLPLRQSESDNEDAVEVVADALTKGLELGGFR